MATTAPTPIVQASRHSSVAAKFLLALAGIAGYALYWWVGKISAIPLRPLDVASMVISPRYGLNFILVAACFMLCVLIGSIVAGGVRFDGGLLCGAMGLIALSYRGGTVGDALRAAAPAGGKPTVFIKFAVDLVLFYGILIAGWLLLWQMHKRGWLRQDSAHDHLEDVHESIFARLTALIAQTLFCGALMILLLQTDSKTQAVVGVAVASYIATLASHSLFPVRPSIWYWIAPLIIGLGSYILAFDKSPEWQLGIVAITGKFWGPAPARALPIDFAGAGTAGSLVAYWISRKFRQAELQQQKEVLSLLSEIPSVLTAATPDPLTTDAAMSAEQSQGSGASGLSHNPPEEIVEDVPAEPLRLQAEVLSLRPGGLVTPATNADPHEQELHRPSLTLEPIAPSMLSKELSLQPESPGLPPEVLDAPARAATLQPDALKLQADVVILRPTGRELPTADLQLPIEPLTPQADSFEIESNDGPAILQLQPGDGELDLSTPTEPEPAGRPPAEGSLHLDDLELQPDVLEFKPQLKVKPKKDAGKPPETKSP